MKRFIKFILILLGVLTLIILIWYYDIGEEKLYHIKEANMYIKIFPSRETTIISFSDKKITKFTDTLDYVKIHKGDDYYTDFFFDNKDNSIIYSRNNSLIDSHFHIYTMKVVSFSDVSYYSYRGKGRYLLNPDYIGISMHFWGAKEKIYLKKKDDSTYIEIKAID